MMKKWFWLVLFIFVALGVVGVKTFFVKTPASMIDTIKVDDSLPIVPNPAKTDDTLRVSADRLFSHIQKLDFERYSDGERSRTRNYITNELRKIGWKPQLQRFPEGVNVFAQHQGTDKAAGAILVAAHYDTVMRSPGADDNGSGIAVALELARILGSHSTPRTLQLAFFDKEEAGLLGSRAFVAEPTKLQGLKGTIVMDMVGYACYTEGCQKYPTGLPVTPPSKLGDFLAVIGDTEHLPLLNAFSPSVDSSTQFPSVLSLPIPMKGLLTPDTLRSDHAPFWYQGIGAVLVTDTANLRTPHYHEPSDKPLSIDRKFFTGAAQIIVNTTQDLLESTASLNTSDVEGT
jgi:Peptidase family M28